MAWLATLACAWTPSGRCETTMITAAATTIRAIARFLRILPPGDFSNPTGNRDVSYHPAIRGGKNNRCKIRNFRDASGIAQHCFSSGRADRKAGATVDV